MKKLPTETKEIPVLPEHLKKYFGEYRAVLFDGWCGEPVNWGFEVLSHLGDELWAEASQYGRMECNHSFPHSTWYLILKSLTPEDAKKKYGDITDYALGVRGGFQTVTYGTTKFCSSQVVDSEHCRQWFQDNKARYSSKK